MDRTYRNMQSRISFSPGHDFCEVAGFLFGEGGSDFRYSFLI